MKPRTRSAKALAERRPAVPMGVLLIAIACAQAVAQDLAPDPQRLAALERTIAADAENLKLAAEYRQLIIARREFDRSIALFEKLAKQKGSGPNVQISLALAYVDKVPTSGDIRRLYLGRDAMNALTRSIEPHPTALAYYTRGLINLFYNSFIFHRTDKGVADLTRALSMVTGDTPPLLVKRIYTALGDGHFRLGNLAKARETWSAGARKFPDDAGFKARLEKQGEPLADIVTTALTASTRMDTTLIEMLPAR